MIDKRIFKLIKSLKVKLDLNKSYCYNLLNAGSYNFDTDTIFINDTFYSDYKMTTAVYLHEIAHSTGHKNRLNRNFQIWDYVSISNEEIVAETTAYMLSIYLQFDETFHQGKLKEYTDLISRLYGHYDRDYVINESKKAFDYLIKFL